MTLNDFNVFQGIIVWWCSDFVRGFTTLVDYIYSHVFQLSYVGHVTPIVYGIFIVGYYGRVVYA